MNPDIFNGVLLPPFSFDANTACLQQRSRRWCHNKVPPNVVIISEANARDTVSQAALGGPTIIDLIPVAAVTNHALSTNDIITLVVDKLKLPVDETVNIPFETGTVTDDVTGTKTSVSGTMHFNECVLSGITLDGTITYSAALIVQLKTVQCRYQDTSVAAVTSLKCRVVLSPVTNSLSDKAVDFGIERGCGSILSRSKKCYHSITRARCPRFYVNTGQRCRKEEQQAA